MTTFRFSYTYEFEIVLINSSGHTVASKLFFIYGSSNDKIQKVFYIRSSNVLNLTKFKMGIYIKRSVDL